MAEDITREELIDLYDEKEGELKLYFARSLTNVRTKPDISAPIAEVLLPGQKVYGTKVTDKDWIKLDSGGYVRVDLLG